MGVRILSGVPNLESLTEMIYTVRIARFRPFYVTENAMLAVRMTRMLLDMGYSRTFLMKEGSMLPVWEEDFESEIESQLAKAFEYGSVL